MVQEAPLTIYARGSYHIFIFPARRTLVSPENYAAIATPGGERSRPCPALAAALACARAARVHAGWLAAMVQEAPCRNHAYHRFHFKSCRSRIELLDIGGSMGTVPRQESVSNGSRQYRELLKWYC